MIQPRSTFLDPRMRELQFLVARRRTWAIRRTVALIVMTVCAIALCALVAGAVAAWLLGEVFPSSMVAVSVFIVATWLVARICVGLATRRIAELERSARHLGALLDWRGRLRDPISRKRLLA